METEPSLSVVVEVVDQPTAREVVHGGSEMVVVLPKSNGGKIRLHGG